jgi:hypothetical protein
MRASWIGVPQCAPASIAGPAVKASRLSWVTPEFFLRGPTMDRPPIGEIAHCGSQAWRWHRVFMGPVSLGGHCRYSPDGMDTRWLLRDVDLARAEEPEGAGATREAAFRVLPCVRSVACAPAAPDPGNPAPRGGIVLAASAAPCRQAGTGARGQDRTARRMAMASRIRQGVSSANNLPHAASTLSGGGLFARTGPLQRLRAAGLSVGMAPDLWGDGRPNRNASWHAACVAAWQPWTAPTEHLRTLKLRQKRKCATTGRRLLRSAEVDHRVPLFAVWSEHRSRPWPELLSYWGAPNLQVINRPAHLEKCAEEAAQRSRRRVAVADPVANEA